MTEGISRRQDWRESWPHAVIREAVVALGVLVIIAALALLIDTPLGESAAQGFRRSGALPQVERAPWYFAGVQEMVSYSALSGVLLFPGAFLLSLLLVPVLARREQAAWPQPLSHAVLGSIVAAVLGLVVGIGGLVAWEQGRTVGGVSDPAALVVYSSLLGAAFEGWRLRRWGIFGQRLLVGLLAAYFFFAAIALLCRGPSWVFVWPFSTGGGA